MAKIVDETGKELPNGTGGILVISKPWPSMIRAIRLRRPPGGYY